MAEHLRALLVLMVLGVGYFYTAKGALTQLIPEETFQRWRNLWLIATLVVFLSHSIWLCTLLLGAIILAYQRREAHVMGLYFVMLLVAPPTPVAIPGFGIIDHLWMLDHYRLLAVTLLLPAALSLLQRSTTLRLGHSSIDWMVLGYVFLMSLLAFRQGNVTSGVRTVFSIWIDIFLPYYVASRSIRSEEGMRQVMTGFLIAAMLVALIAIFEMLGSWKLYQGVLNALGVGDHLFGSYLTRAGFLRPNTSVGNSIVVGYVLMIAFGFFLYLKEFLTRPYHRWLGMALIAAGLIASLSRGPWLGAILLLLLFVLMGPGSIKNLVRITFCGVIGFVVLSVVPMGRTLISLLPIVGDAEQGNVEYRANLLVSAWPVMGRNILFGSDDYLDAPELQVMKQGQGIIDIVNTYIGIALEFGVVGLVLFAGAFLTMLFKLKGAERMAQRFNPGVAVMGRALLATIAAIMFTIYTVSSISVVPVMYWSVLGLSVAYVGLIKAYRRNPT